MNVFTLSTMRPSSRSTRSSQVSTTRQQYRKPRILAMTWLLVTLLAYGTGKSQDTVSLNQCYRLLEQNYPMVKQKALIGKSSDLTRQAIQKNYLPQVSLNAQATYQSDVPHVPISTPGNDIPIANKDQYRATLDVNQLLYDGGSVRSSLQVETLNSLIQQEQVEVTLHQLKSGINQKYFSILLLQEEDKLLSLVEENLNSQLHEVRSAIRNGAALPSSDDVIQAEILTTRQKRYENRADREATLKYLSNLLGTSLARNAFLSVPDLEVNTMASLARPELKFYSLRQQQIEASSGLLGKSKAPKLMLFAQGGYGNPGLNLLDNTFQPFFMGGVKLSWNLLDWDMVHDQRQALLIKREIIDNEAEVFDLNTSLELNRYETEMNKLKQLIQTDDELIALRSKVVRTSYAQLRNGTITASEYLLDYNAMNQATIMKKTHEISLLLAEANYIVTQGTSIEP